VRLGPRVSPGAEDVPVGHHGRLHPENEERQRVEHGQDHDDDDDVPDLEQLLEHRPSVLSMTKRGWR
jgi:hypothetical protein